MAKLHNGPSLEVQTAPDRTYGLSGRTQAFMDALWGISATMLSAVGLSNVSKTEADAIRRCTFGDGPPDCLNLSEFVEGNVTEMFIFMYTFFTLAWQWKRHASASLNTSYTNLTSTINIYLVGPLLSFFPVFSSVASVYSKKGLFPTALVVISLAALGVAVQLHGLSLQGSTPDATKRHKFDVVLFISSATASVLVGSLITSKSWVPFSTFWLCVAVGGRIRNRVWPNHAADDKTVGLLGRRREVRKFSMERLECLTDAVLSIVATLMLLELPLPFNRLERGLAPSEDLHSYLTSAYPEYLKGLLVLLFVCVVWQLFSTVNQQARAVEDTEVGGVVFLAVICVQGACCLLPHTLSLMTLFAWASTPGLVCGFILIAIGLSFVAMTAVMRQRANAKGVALPHHTFMIVACVSFIVAGGASLGLAISGQNHEFSVVSVLLILLAVLGLHVFLHSFRR